MKIMRCFLEDVEYVLEALNIVRAERVPLDRLTKQEDMEDFLLDLMNHVYVALEENRVIGYLVAYELHQIDRPGKMMYLYEIYILEEYRQKEVATQLVSALKDSCIRSGFVRMFSYVGCENEEGKKLFQKTGGKQIREEKELSFEWGLYR